ncbi:MAG: orotidine-5'-phosphate decarboxylase [Gemmatimonadetes bacterium]|nr:orotidine-5'-phosphate decarboxylase [Gemmatimonadota bacterium]MDA1103037.1 orotidine-5'-phosphate decarboxylase [Gemmatimonadota bacterium]
MSRVIVPLDVISSGEALALVDLLGDRCDFYKVGFELYTRTGPDVVRELIARGKRVFLDIKLHDIPNTVAGAVRAASDLGVDLLTVHAAGGPTMLDAAAKAASGDLRLLAVTVLTSLSPDEMGTVWDREIRSVREEVGRLALMARDRNMDGVVASALETSWIRGQVGDDFLIVTPGIRPAGADREDQNRVATPSEAVRAGADYLVIGRPITASDDPAGALSAIQDEIEQAEQAR